MLLSLHLIDFQSYNKKSKLLESQSQQTPTSTNQNLLEFTDSSFLLSLNPISTGLFFLVVAVGGSIPPRSIKFDPDILEH